MVGIETNIHQADILVDSASTVQKLNRAANEPEAVASSSAEHSTETPS
jgi:hypothetical protein